MASGQPQNGQQFDGASWGEGEYSVGEHIQHSDQTQNPTFSIAQASPGDPASISAEDAGEYDPESVTISAVPNLIEDRASSASSIPHPAKPKTTGGFLVGSSDDEDDTPPPVSRNLMAHGANAPSSALDPSPIPSSLPSAQVNNGTAGTSSQAVTSANLRNPVNTVNTLEDRIQEDARGDMDAWIALMAEYRRRNKLVELRGVYNRFLEIFPQAVRILQSSTYPWNFFPLCKR
jgi:cleavage stimulation factor subunit 3